MTASPRPPQRGNADGDAHRVTFQLGRCHQFEDLGGEEPNSAVATHSTESSRDTSVHLWQLLVAVVVGLQPSRGQPLWCARARPPVMGTPHWRWGFTVGWDETME